MTSFIKKSIIVLLVITAAFSLSAQDPHFTQYFSNPLALNPAFSGSAGCSRIAANLRNEPSLADWSYTAAGITYDQYIHPIRSGLGFAVASDQANNFVYNLHADILYALNIKIRNKVVVRPAVKLGFGSFHVDWSNIRTWGTVLFDGYDLVPHNESGARSYLYFNIGSGLAVTFKNFVFGIAGDHLNRPVLGVYISRMPVKWTIHMSSQINIKEIASITPAIIYMKQRDFDQLAVNVMAKIWYIKSGIGTRFEAKFNGHFNCITAMIGFQNKWMSIGYSHDFWFYGINDGIMDADELSMVFKFNCKNKTDKFPIALVNGF
jgi:type IX secretion system PorP/SprF family membrane protein